MSLLILMNETGMRESRLTRARSSEDPVYTGGTVGNRSYPVAVHDDYMYGRTEKRRRECTRTKVPVQGATDVLGILSYAL